MDNKIDDFLSGKPVSFIKNKKTGIDKAREVKNETYLNGLIRYNGVIMTRKEWIKNLIKDGFDNPQIKQVNKIKDCSRRALFRMDNEEQKAHEEKQARAGKKNTYFLYKDSYSYELTRVEYDFAISLLD